MHLRHPARVSLALFALAAVVLEAAGCGRPVQTFVVDPGSAEPVAPITLKGLKLPAGQRDGLVVAAGATPMLFNYLPDGTVVAQVPLYMGSAGWPVVPTKPQTVKVYRNGTLIAQSSTPLRILPLQKAPGTTRQLALNLDTIAASFDGFTKAFPVPGSQGAGIAEAISGVLHAAGTGGQNSIMAFADGTAPLEAGQKNNLDLVDAVLASSGLAAHEQAMADMLGRFRVQGITPSATCLVQGNDYKLACAMQFQEWFARTMEKLGAGIEKADPMLTVLGFLSIVVPEAAIPVVLTELVNIFLVKLAPTMYPSKFSSFQIALKNPAVVPGGTTNATFAITAVNEPASLTLGDLIKTVLGILELVVPEAKLADDEKFTKDAVGVSWMQRTIANQVESSSGVIRKTVTWLVENIGGPDVTPGIWDGNVCHVPFIAVGPFQIDPGSVGLLTLKEADSSVVQTVEQTQHVLDWQGLAPGRTTVQAWPRGPDTAEQVFKPLFLALPKLGSFGRADTGSDQVPVAVTSGDVQYNLANHGTHTADGSAPASSAGAAGDGTSMQPNEVDALMWDTRWSLASKAADGNWLWIVCTTPFSTLGASIPFGTKGSSSCYMTWYDDPANPNASGGAMTGTFSFDSCKVVADNGVRPTAVEFSGAFGATFDVITNLQGSQPGQEQDDVTGTFDAAFTLDDTVQDGSPNVTAIEAQCSGWPPAP